MPILRIQFFLVKLMQSFRKEFPEFSKFFNFDTFNQVQQKCYAPITKNSRNMVVSAPTSSGKTVIFELAVMSQLKQNPTNLKCLYLAPIKSLCHEKSVSWHQKFHGRVRIFQLTSDTTAEEENAVELEQVNLVIATPEKIDAFSRKSLDFLSQLNLLLVDEVHMLNFEQRGATLEAVISRIMSISTPRIIAVSATIPNIKQVAQWLKVSPEMTFVFGDEYRPVKIQKVVLGFKSANNPYTFQKVLNYKLTEVIRTYSQDKGVLVFCQTQKGTQMACQQIISDMKQRQFIDCDQSLLALIQGSKRVTNTSLQLMIPQGIAFHNAGLTHHDRTIVQKLFLENRIRILCTTSTLAMGINLPARLVVIKSTQCYKGSGKGYQEYTQIEMDQMMGRAGRPPFDTEGTVVIMTEKQNYNRYLNSGKLETLESHLYDQLTQHINAEIALKSLKCFQDVLKYFMNSFCYIRMKNSPSTYSIKTDLQTHIQKICLESIQKLNTNNLIKYYPQNENIVTRQLGINVARNSIEIDTIVNVCKEISKIKTQRDFLGLLCEAEEIKRYRNKLDQRKWLKQLNQKNKYPLKTAISTPQKKCYVLIQSELDGRHIENWQLRKQAKEMLYFLRRLTFCTRTASSELKIFWPFFWSCVLNKYFTGRFWERNQQGTIRQFEELNEKWKSLAAKGFKNIGHVMENLGMLDTVCQKGGQFGQAVGRRIGNLREAVVIRVGKNDGGRIMELPDRGMSQFSQDEIMQEPRNPPQTSKDTLLQISFTGFFDQSLQYLTLIIGQGLQLYTVRTLNSEQKHTKIAISSTKNYNIGIIKSNVIGFDEFYQVLGGRDVRKIEDVCGFVDGESCDRMNKGNKDKDKERNREKEKGKEREREKEMKEGFSDDETSSNIDRLSSLQFKNKSLNKSFIEANKKPTGANRKSKSIQRKNSSTPQPTPILAKILKPKILKTKSPRLISRKKTFQQFDQQNQEQISNTLKPGTYIPLNQYKCWKPGFRNFQESQAEEQDKPTAQKLLIIDEKSSGSKQSIEAENTRPTIKSKQGIAWQKYAYNEKKMPKKTTTPQTKRPEPVKIPPENPKKDLPPNPYDYFLNLFSR